METMQQFDALLSRIEAEASPRRATISHRKQVHENMISSSDLELMLEMQTKLNRLLSAVTENKLDLDDPGILGPLETEALMAEYLDERDIKELLEVRREMIRTAVFAHLTEECRREGATEPENTNRSLPVPGLGKRFVREGCGRKPPKLDEEKFKKLLGDDWEQAYKATVVEEQVIPEHVEYEFSPAAVMAMAEDRPGILEVLREALIPGEYRSPSFTVRDLKEKNE